MTNPPQMNTSATPGHEQERPRSHLYTLVWRRDAREQKYRQKTPRNKTNHKGSGGEKTAPMERANPLYGSSLSTIRGNETTPRDPQALSQVLALLRSPGGQLKFRHAKSSFISLNIASGCFRETFQ